MSLWSLPPAPARSWCFCGTSCSLVLLVLLRLGATALLWLTITTPWLAPPDVPLLFSLCCTSFFLLYAALLLAFYAEIADTLIFFWPPDFPCGWPVARKIMPSVWVVFTEPMASSTLLSLSMDPIRCVSFRLADKSPNFLL